MLMSEDTLEADYVIVGAGAVGMAFADALLTDSDATMIMVDRRHKPGGHWNDAYPFVCLHAPSAYYGVNSRLLGADRIEETGFNRGPYELATGPEICAYYDRLMRQRFLPSGRVTYLPVSDFGKDGIAHLPSRRSPDHSKGPQKNC
jgi:cation diffusion facilitator CzcD-associated flavoprotein CzcO